MDFLIQTIFYFVLFNIIIIVFGYNILSMFFKKILITKPSNIKTFILSLIIGFTSYIILSYIFITIWNFNVFTAYYFYVFFDIAGLIYVIKRRRLSSSLRKENPPEISLKKRILDSIIKNKSIFILISVFVYIIIFYILKFWPQISSSTAQFGYDPYLWEGEVYYLLKFNSLDYIHTLYAYPAGLVLYFGGILSYKSSIGLEQLHFAVKIFPTLILIENMFLMALLAYEMFPKRKIFIFLMSTSMFFFYFFLYRSFLFVPSILITELEIFLFYLLLYKDIPNKFSNIFFGMVLGSMILIHPFYGLLNIAFFFVYRIIYSLFHSKLENSKNIMKNIVYKIKLTFTDNIVTIVIIIGIFFIYFFNLLIKYNYNWGNNAYIGYFSLTLMNSYPIQNFTFLLSKNLLKFFNSNIILNIFAPSFPSTGVFDYLNVFLRNTNNSFYYFWFAIICLIWPLWKYYGRKYDKLIIFGQFAFILSLLFYLFRPFLFTYNFWRVYRLRIPEIIVPYTIIITSIGILFLSIELAKIIKRLASFVKEKVIKFSNRDIVEKKHKHKIKNVNNIISTIFLLVILLYSINFQVKTNIGLNIYIFDNSYDNFLFNFREIENNYDQNRNQQQVIHFDSNDVKIEYLLHAFFSWDHTLSSTKFNDNILSFIDYWNNDISIGQLTILTTFDSHLFDYAKNNNTHFGIIIYSNNEIIVIEKINNIS